MQTSKRNGEVSVTHFYGLNLKESATISGFLVKSTGSSSAMWERHGIDYCKKVSMEFNRTDSKAQRFNYKKRLLEVKERHPQLGSVVDKCLENYCN